LVKGAAVVDRIQIGGVSCFILSREPIPELATELKQQKRRKGASKPVVHRLSTIDERQEHTHESTSSFPQTFAKGDYRQRDVILHLTGGGFFAHIIASDLPYLLDWSNATGAVVVCPEYALLPENKFPAALQDVECVYQNLIGPSIACTLGFEVNRLIISGESVGGNLAVALCVKLEMDALTQSRASDETARDIMSDDEEESDTEEVDLQSSPEDCVSHAILPHAMLLSCPVLDLSNGTQPFDSNYGAIVDPVLSTGLVSAISDAYVPKGIRKNISLISPLYATDELLERFPPTLIFGSSHDPVLDDSIVLNQRLNHLGVSCELRAVENLPHAYLGLGTAGFPEARQVQRQIEEWLIEQLHSP
jgi:acetyl esterase/lipase